MVVWVEELRWYCIGTRTRDRLLLFILNLCMRVIEVNWDDLLRNWRLKRTCDLPCYSISQIKAKQRIISSWRWLNACLLEFPSIHVSISY